MSVSVVHDLLETARIDLLKTKTRQMLCEWFLSLKNYVDVDTLKPMMACTDWMVVHHYQTLYITRCSVPLYSRWLSSMLADCNWRRLFPTSRKYSATLWCGSRGSDPGSCFCDLLGPANCNDDTTQSYKLLVDMQHGSWYHSQNNLKINWT